MSQAYRAILFDMDGVLIDTHGPVTAFWEEQAARYGVTLSAQDFTRHIYGHPATQTLAALFPQLDAGQRQTVLAEGEATEAAQTYTALPGVLDLLRALRRHDMPTALVTSGNRLKVNAVAGALPIADLFMAIVTVDDVQRGKPHPEGYQLAARRLRLPPEQCIVFEDSLAGVRAAVAAGALCIGVQPDQQAAALRQAGARATIADFTRVAIEAEGPALHLNGDTALPLRRLTP